MSRSKGNTIHGSSVNSGVLWLKMWLVKMMVIAYKGGLSEMCFGGGDMVVRMKLNGEEIYECWLLMVKNREMKSV